MHAHVQESGWQKSPRFCILYSAHQKVDWKHQFCWDPGLKCLMLFLSVQETAKASHQPEQDSVDAGRTSFHAMDQVKSINIGS